VTDLKKARVACVFSEMGVDHEMFGHYFFVECETDPETAPLLVWTNGGPGASSFFGLFVEFGPFLLSGASRQTQEYNDTKVPSLFYNPFTWSKVTFFGFPRLV
jgi:carboxypeptidase C (cathepsin A)